MVFIGFQPFILRVLPKGHVVRSVNDAEHSLHVRALDVVFLAEVVHQLLIAVARAHCSSHDWCLPSLSPVLVCGLGWRKRGREGSKEGRREGGREGGRELREGRREGEKRKEGKEGEEGGKVGAREKERREGKCRVGGKKRKIIIMLQAG